MTLILNEKKLATVACVLWKEMSTIQIYKRRFGLFLGTIESSEHSFTGNRSYCKSFQVDILNFSKH